MLEGRITQLIVNSADPVNYKGPLPEVKVRSWVNQERLRQTNWGQCLI